MIPSELTATLRELCQRIDDALADGVNLDCTSLREVCQALTANCPSWRFSLEIEGGQQWGKEDIRYRIFDGGATFEGRTLKQVYRNYVECGKGVPSLADIENQLREV